VSTPRPGADEVHRITNAPEPLSADQSRRERRYLVQMGIRVLCFLLAVFLLGRVPGWVTGILLVAAVVLPYVAVILANAGRERRDEEDFAPEIRALGASSPHRPLAPGVPGAREDDGPDGSRDRADRPGA
jgi:hypothetical protein